MSDFQRHPASPTAWTPATASGGDSVFTQRADVARVLRNTYALLSMTLLFSGAVAAAAVAFKLPAPGMILTLIGYFGLLFAIHKTQHSAASVPLVFALTGFMGYTLGPLLSAILNLPGGANTIALALGTTGATFLVLSAYVLATKKDFSFMGGFLFATVLEASHLPGGADPTGLARRWVADLGGMLTAIAPVLVERFRRRFPRA